MRPISELIEYHNECEFLDFKREEYNENNKPNLIKDVLAFANADVQGDRYIIIGVKKSAGIVELNNIEPKYDSANIQQYIHANITPELQIEYDSFAYNDNNLVVLTIKDPVEQPYMTSKDVFYKAGKLCLKANECWVRKGSYQVVASRNDYDRMYAPKTETPDFARKIRLTFEASGSDTIVLKSVNNLQLPSSGYEKELRKVIEHKEKLFKENPNAYKLSIRRQMFPWEGSSYEERDLETLRKNLETVRKTYYDEDAFELFEKSAHKLNINILNTSEYYLEDSSIELFIPKIKNVFVSEKIYSVRNSYRGPFSPLEYNQPSFDFINYPHVIEDADNFIVSENTGNIKHNIMKQAFKVPIRVTFLNVSNDLEIKLKCKVYGKNLKLPLEQDLIIRVISQSQLL
jgi:hypothetical protein